MYHTQPDGIVQYLLAECRHLAVYTGELGYDGPLYDGFLHITDDMLGPSPMQIKYSSYVYDGFCICRPILSRSYPSSPVPFSQQR